MSRHAVRAGLKPAVPSGTETNFIEETRPGAKNAIGGRRGKLVGLLDGHPDTKFQSIQVEEAGFDRLSRWSTQ